MDGRRPAQAGSASVEQVGLVALIAVTIAVLIAAIVAGDDLDSTPGLGRAIATKIVCAPRAPDHCRHHPLVPAYGWPLARLARALAPPPLAKPGPSGRPLAPVDFRRCRRESCALAAGPHLTASGRRTTAFVELDDRRHSLGWVELTYWFYRPGLGWEQVVRRATQADVEAAGDTRLLQKDDPALVPLETLPGRDHYDFPAAERPPWQWNIRGRYPGWSS
jgi:hypothetical protein